MCWKLHFNILTVSARLLVQIPEASKVPVRQAPWRSARVGTLGSAREIRIRKEFGPRPFVRKKKNLQEKNLKSEGWEKRGFYANGGRNPGASTAARCLLLAKLPACVRKHHRAEFRASRKAHRRSNHAARVFPMHIKNICPYGRSAHLNKLNS